MRRKILVLDSDAMWQKFCKVKFRETYGIEVVCASDARTAREAVNVHNPGAIFLEMILPGEDGFQFLEEMKSKSWSRKIPVFVVSNLSHPADIQNCISLGAAGYFNKKKLNRTDSLFEAVAQYI